MFAKLVALILALGACGGGLLAMRQSRLQAAHELTAARLRLREHEERLLRLKAEIAGRTTPPSVGWMLEEARMSNAVGPLEPVIDHPAELPLAWPAGLDLTAWDPELGRGIGGGDQP